MNFFFWFACLIDIIRLHEAPHHFLRDSITSCQFLFTKQIQLDETLVLLFSSNFTCWFD